MIPLRLAPASAMLMLLAACGSPDTTNPDTAPVPLPRAWPRTPLYEAAYAPVAPGSDIEVAEALEPRITRRRGADSWIDISYPAYRATLYLSDLRFSSPAEASDAIDNRLERMALNAGGKNMRQTAFDTPAGYSAIVATVSSGCITPVQFVASSPSRVVSGAFTLQTLPHSADSLAPTLEAVRADIVHLIKQLR